MPYLPSEKSAPLHFLASLDHSGADLFAALRQKGQECVAGHRFICLHQAQRTVGGITPPGLQQVWTRSGVQLLEVKLDAAAACAASAVSFTTCVTTSDGGQHQPWRSTAPVNVHPSRQASCRQPVHQQPRRLCAHSQQQTFCWPWRWRWLPAKAAAAWLKQTQPLPSHQRAQGTQEPLTARSAGHAHSLGM